MPKTVWLVAYGDYADYCIAGVYSSEAVARLAVNSGRFFSPEDHWREPVELVVDARYPGGWVGAAPPSDGGALRFRISVRRDGTAVAAQPCLDPVGIPYWGRDAFGEQLMLCVCGATDLNTAIEAARSHQRRLVELGAWPPPEVT
jgi:hypothetical protein